jgi:hypothetical protein
MVCAWASVRLILRSTKEIKAYAGSMKTLARAALAKVMGSGFIKLRPKEFRRAWVATNDTFHQELL